MAGRRAVITDFLIEHKWMMPALLAALIVVGPSAGAWLTLHRFAARTVFALSLLPLLALTLIPVDRELFERCAWQVALPTPDRVELFANLVLFVPPVLLGGVITRRPLLALAVGSAVSASVEALQAAFTAIGRSCDSTDWLANTIGALVGSVLALLAVAIAARRNATQHASRVAD